MLDKLIDAHVVLVIDVMTRNALLVFGRDALQEVIRSGKGESLQLAYIELDQVEESDNPEKAVAMIGVAKCQRDYPLNE